MSLGKRIRAARIAAGLTQDEVARRFDISRNAVSMWEAGKSVPDSEKMPELARLLRIETEILWSGAKSQKYDDSEHMAIDHTASKDEAYVAVREYDVRAAMGGGALVETEKLIGAWSLPGTLLRSQTTAPISRLVFLQAIGESMAPDFPPGARVLVDMSDTAPTPPGIFVVFDGMGLVLKRVEYLAHSDPPRIRLSSINPAYLPYERTLDESIIRGRVLGRWAWV